MLPLRAYPVLSADYALKSELKKYLRTLWFQKNVMAGKKIVWVENGLNIGNRASGLGLSIKDMDVLLSALNFFEIIKF